MMLMQFLEMKGGWLLALFLCAMSLIAPGRALATTTVKMATYNIHGGVGSDGKKDLQRIALVLKSTVPEVVVLNEVNRYFLGHFQDVQIAEELGGEWRAVFGKTITRPLADYGNAILTRLPVVSHESWLLSDFPHQERRGLLRVSVKKNDELIHVFAVHMGLNARMRERHSLEILRIMEKFDDGHRVLLGDFNEQRSRSPGTALANFSESLKDCAAYYGLGPQVTFPSTRTFRRIDFIWLGQSLSSSSCYVPIHRDARLASDHLPVVAKVNIPKNGESSRKGRQSIEGITYSQDFSSVPPSHIPSMWKEIGIPSKGGFIGGVAVVGKEHVWRQSSVARLEFKARETSPSRSHLEVAAAIKMIASGGGKWEFKLGEASIEISHETGMLPQITVAFADTIIMERELPSMEIDPYDWNVYRIALSPVDDSPSASLKVTGYVNDVKLGALDVDPKKVAVPSPLAFVTRGAESACELYVDEVVVGSSSAINSWFENNSGGRIIELDKKSPSGWLDWW